MTAQAEIRTCGNCGHRVCCEYDGDNYVGKCPSCGEYKVYQYCPREEPKPETKPELLGVQVDYWEDEGLSHTETFSDPDEGCEYAD